MSETAAPAAESVPPGDGISAGMLLRQAREAAGLHVATLAANLKVPVRKLEALEEDRYDLLPDAVFVRALASSVCRTLKVDARPVLERLPRTAQPRLEPATPVINAPFRAPGDAAGGGWLGQLSRPAVLTVLALLLGALVIVFLPVAQRSGAVLSSVGGAALSSVSSAPSAGSASEPVMPPPGAAAAVATAPAPEEVAGPATSPVPGAQPPAGSLPTAAAPAASPAAPAASAVPAPSAATAGAGAVAPMPAAPAGEASGIVVFRTRGPSWVEVTDATGATVLRRLLGAGESARASGALPLAVVVGSVAQTEVQVRGEPFDLAPIARDNVARFQVK